MAGATGELFPAGVLLGSCGDAVAVDGAESFKAERDRSDVVLPAFAVVGFVDEWPVGGVEPDADAGKGGFWRAGAEGSIEAEVLLAYGDFHDDVAGVEVVELSGEKVFGVGPGGFEGPP